MDLKKYHKDLGAFYTDHLDRHGVGCVQSLGWKNTEAQQVRLDQLLKVITTERSFSINDLGCGFGDLNIRMHEKGFKDFLFHGYDINKDMIEACLSIQKMPSADFKVITTANEMLEADYTVASGIFNLRPNCTPEEMTKYLTDTIQAMFIKSKKGIAFNCLSTYSDLEKRSSDLHYTDPCELFNFCKKNLSKNVALLHDYGQYDFTTIVRKD